MVQHRFLRNIGKVHIKEADITLKAGVGHRTVMMGMLPGPDVGTLWAFHQFSFFVFLCVYQSNVSFIGFLLLIQKSEDPMGSGQSHYHHVDLVGYLADGAGKLFGHVQEGHDNTDAEGHAGKA